jgi:hypothetical protein
MQYWLVAMRRRIVLILLFPVVIFLFVVGWVLCSIGGKETSNKVSIESETDIIEREKDSTVNSDTEMGLIEEKAEDQLATQQ